MRKCVSLSILLTFIGAMAVPVTFPSSAEAFRRRPVVKRAIQRNMRKHARHRAWCSNHPIKCAARQQKNRTWCNTHPVRCGQLRTTDSTLEFDLSESE